MQDFDELLKVGGKPADGFYHLQLINAEEAEDATRINLKYEVASPGPENGKHINETLWLKGLDDDESGYSEAQAWAKVFTHAFALGMLTKDDYERARAAGVDCDIDFPAAVGKQCVGEFKTRTFFSKKKNEKVTVSELHKRVYHLTAPEADRANIDPEIAAIVGVIVQPKPNATGGAKRGRKSKAELAAAAAAQTQQATPSVNGTVSAPTANPTPTPTTSTPAAAPTSAVYDDI